MKTLSRFRAVAAVSAFAAILGMAAIPLPAHADYEAREALMKKLGGAMKLLGQTAKGEKPFGPETAAAAATVEAVARDIPATFKDPATTPKSRSKPEVWSQWDRFVADSKAFSDTVPALVAAAGGTDRAALGAALGATGKTCGACHDTFRTKDD